jgi:uncharacterized protein YbaP (TraB family)
MKKLTGFFALAALTTSPLAAQDDPSPAETAPTETAPTENAPTENAIVVTAQRSGAPMWTVTTATGTVILVGEIRAIPKTTPWEPARLEEATRAADRVILGARPKISPGDVLRLMFSGSKFTKLPGKTVASDYLGPDQWQRLQSLGTAHDEDYSRKSFLLTSFEMLRKQLRFNRDTARDVSDVVKDASEKAKVPITRAATLRGEDIIDNLADAPPQAHIPCLDAAMDAVEAGPQIVEERATNWRRFKIPAVMNNPLETALGQCWPWADETLGSELRTIWVERIAEASAAKGTTLAVVPLRVLAESGGVLDQLDTRGFDIAGPPWK